MNFDANFRFFFAFVLVLALHLIFLMLPMAFQKSQIDKKSSTLKLTLKSAQREQGRELSKRESQAETPQALSSQLNIDLNEVRQLPEQLSEVPVALSSEQPHKNKLLDSNDIIEMPDVKARRFDQSQLVTAVVLSATAQASTPKLRGFGIAQWKKKQAPTYAREVSMPLLLASRAINVGSSNGAGQSTDLVRGSSGKAACWQQRGSPGGAQQWYRVPLSLCGHLNKP